PSRSPPRPRPPGGGVRPALPSPDLQLTWRPLTPGDTGDLYALLRRIEEYDDPPYPSTREEVDDTALSHWTDLAANSLAGFDTAGELRAYGVLLEAEARRPAPRTLLEGGSDPEVRHRGVGSALLTWQLQRAKELLAGAQEPGRVVVHLEEGMSASA